MTSCEWSESSRGRVADDGAELLAVAEAEDCIDIVRLRLLSPFDSSVISMSWPTGIVLLMMLASISRCN